MGTAYVKFDRNRFTAERATRDGYTQECVKCVDSELKAEIVTEQDNKEKDSVGPPDYGLVLIKDKTYNPFFDVMVNSDTTTAIPFKTDRYWQSDIKYTGFANAINGNCGALQPFNSLEFTKSVVEDVYVATVDDLETVGNSATPRTSTLIRQALVQDKYKSVDGTTRASLLSYITLTIGRAERDVFRKNYKAQYDTAYDIAYDKANRLLSTNSLNFIQIIEQVFAASPITDYVGTVAIYAAIKDAGIEPPKNSSKPVNEEPNSGPKVSAKASSNGGDEVATDAPSRDNGGVGTSGKNTTEKFEKIWSAKSYSGTPEIITFSFESVHVPGAGGGLASGLLAQLEQRVNALIADIRVSYKRD
jgi:hypothetical protein